MRRACRGNPWARRSHLHQGDGVHEDAELPGADGKGVEVELPDGGIGPEEVVAAKGASSDHQGVAGDYEPGLGVVPQNIVRRF